MSFPASLFLRLSFPRFLSFPSNSHSRSHSQLADRKRQIDLLLNKIEACLINAEMGGEKAGARNSMGQDIWQLLEDDLSNESICALFEETAKVAIFPDTFL